MKKWLIVSVVILLMLCVAVSVAAKVILTKDFLVAELEESIDSRVQVGELELSLTTMPAQVTLRKVIITQRDDYANRQVKHDQRPLLASGEVYIEELSFDVALLPLLSKKVSIKQLDVVGLNALVKMHEDGTTSLNSLFAEPEKKKKEKKKKGFNAKDNQDFVTELETITLKDSRFSLVVEKTGLLLEGSELNLDLTDIKIDPNALEVVNEAALKMAAKVEVFSNEKDRKKYGEVSFSGPARARIFDPATGEIEPDVEMELSLADNSYIDTDIPYVEKLWEWAGKFEKYGLSLGQRPKKIDFGRSKKVHASYQRGRVDLHQSLSLLIKDWELALNQGCWFDSADESHDFLIDLSASAKASDSVREKAGKISKWMPKELRQPLTDQLIGGVIKGGKLTLSIRTNGLLSRPRFSVKNIPAMEGVSVDTGGDLIGSALEQFSKGKDSQQESGGKKDKDDELKRAAGGLLRGLLGQ